MGERKVLNKYYPPDFDPAEIVRRKGARKEQIKACSAARETADGMIGSLLPPASLSLRYSPRHTLIHAWCVLSIVFYRSA